MRTVRKPQAKRFPRALCAAALGLAALGAARSASAQAFNSQSTGADGAFDLTGTPSGTIVDFDPRVLRVNRDPAQPPIDPQRDNVFHFTNVVVPTGVTVKLSARWTSGPVYWLATGTVAIAGTLDLTGQQGHSHTNSTVLRVPAVPGPGGFPGGIGGNHSTSSRGRAHSGSGPAGGIGASTPGGDSHRGFGGGFVGSTFLVPLTGGSGGGGGSYDGFEQWGAGGGAGGGALLIASSVSINVTGQILAHGGRGGIGNQACCSAYYGGAGAGGAIRFVAPLINGNGTLHAGSNVVAGGGCFCQPTSGPTSSNSVGGRIRLEAFRHEWSFNIQGSYTSGSPLSSFVPTTPPPSLQVIGVDGQTVATDPTGSFDLADVTINDSGPVEIVIRARNVPLTSGSPAVDTVPKLYLFSLEGTDIALDATKLEGSFESSTATVTATLPPGFTRGYVRASWSVP